MVLTPQVKQTVQRTLNTYLEMPELADLVKEDEQLSLGWEYEKGYRRRYVVMYAAGHE